MSKQTDVVSQTSSPAQLHLRDFRALSAEQLRAVEEFVKQVGGVEQARQALAAIGKLKDAA